jgi:hypothetical protein
MASSHTSATPSTDHAQAALPSLRWRTWPLVDQPRWSWSVPLGIVLMGAAVADVGGNWLMGAAAIVGLAATLWQYFVPSTYEISSLGLSREALGRVRLVPWQAIGSYQPRATGIVLYQRADPTAIDNLRNIFVPHPVDPDDPLCAIRQYLPHAVELP